MENQFYGLNPNSINQKTPVINPKMIKLARESRSLSQKELVLKLNLTQGHFSKIESGFWSISKNILEKLSYLLYYPISFFIEPGDVYPLPWNFYRKNRNISQKKSDQINAIINIQRKHIEKLLQSVELDNLVKYVNIDIESKTTPEDIARILREYYQIPSGPIDNMTSFLEDIGIFVINTDFGIRDFSGVSTRVMNANHVIFLNSNMPGDRQRFTLAHEFGHVVMHNFPDENMEIEANRFAAEFLMPENDISYSLDNLNLEKLAYLKLYWKVSMSSILMKAKALRKITDKKYSLLWQQMGSRGYRLNEPIEYSIPREEPHLIKDTLKIFIDQFGYNIEQLSNLFNLYEDELKSFYFPESKNLTLLR